MQEHKIQLLWHSMETRKANGWQEKKGQRISIIAKKVRYR